MIDSKAQATILNWATGKCDISTVLSIGHSLKNIKKGRTIAIIAPSYLLHKIDYYPLFNRPNVDTMIVNRGFMIPGSHLSTLYLPLTVHGRTSAWNNSYTYLSWLRNYNGTVLHGMNHNDGTNPWSPYLIASVAEAKNCIQKCPKTKIVPWHHAWSNLIPRNDLVKGLTALPNYNKWTPSRIPWGHCGAISGFAIPLAMTLGYKNIYIVAMGYNLTVTSCIHEPWARAIEQKNQGDPWLHAAPTRFKNQIELAKKVGINLRVGPAGLLEKQIKIFNTFNSISDIK